MNYLRRTGTDTPFAAILYSSASKNIASKLPEMHVDGRVYRLLLYRLLPRIEAIEMRFKESSLVSVRHAEISAKRFSSSNKESRHDSELTGGLTVVSKMKVRRYSATL